MMNLVGSINNAFVKCLDFKSRSSRSDFWIFILFTEIITTIAFQIDQVLELKLLPLYYLLPMRIYDINTEIFIGHTYLFLIFLFFIPKLSLYIRRLHDINRSGWWLLIVLIPFIGLITLIFFFCLKGSKNRNDFGEIPT